MARGTRIIDRDRGFKAFTKRMKKLGRKGVVKVGILSGEGSAPSGDADLTVLDVASIHEFGLGNNPERSFIRAWADQDEEKHRAIERKLVESVIKGANTAGSALEKLGVALAAAAQKFIQDGRVAPATIKSGDEGTNTTLIDTGQLVTSISHEVE